MLSTLSFLKSTCNVKRKSAAVQPNGEAQWAFATNLTGVACAVQGLSAREIMSAGRETGVSQFEVFFPAGTDVRTDDLITLFANSFLPSTAVLAVTSPGIDDGGEQAYLRVLATLTTGSDAA